MIGYLFLGLALLCGVLKGYCGKRSSGTLVLASDALAVNTVRMLACILIGLFAVAIGGGVETLAVTHKTLAITALSGIASLSCALADFLYRLLIVTVDVTVRIFAVNNYGAVVGDIRVGKMYHHVCRLKP